MANVFYSSRFDRRENIIETVTGREEKGKLCLYHGGDFGNLFSGVLTFRRNVND